MRSARGLAWSVSVCAVLGVAATACGSEPLDAIAIDPSSLMRDLVAHWRFDETEGTLALDGSGNGHDGLITGGTWDSGGQFGGALSLASGDSVSVTDFPKATANWTVSVWIRSTPEDLATNTMTFSTILSAENQYAGGWEVHLDNRPNYHRYDAAYWPGGTMADSDYVRVFCDCIETDRWIHLATVWDAALTNTMTFFVDGRAVDQTPMPSPILTGDTTLYMGTWNQGGRYFAGELDDVAIWSRALEAPEIAALTHYSPGSTVSN